MTTCIQCNTHVVCGKNKNHAYKSHTVVIFINRIQSVRTHEKYKKLKDEYRKKGCKLLFYEDELHRVNNRKKKVYRKIKHAILRAGVRVTNVIIYFWENENSFEYKSSRSLHPNIILGDLSSIKCLADKRWFLISTRITNNRGVKPPQKNFGIAIKNMGYLDIKVDNEDNCILILEKMKYWEKLEELVSICQRVCRGSIQYGGRLLPCNAVF